MRKFSTFLFLWLVYQITSQSITGNPLISFNSEMNVSTGMTEVPIRQNSSIQTELKDNSISIGLVPDTANLRREEIKIFPNPVHGSFTLSFPKAKNTELNLRIFDVIGNEILNQNLNGSENKDWLIDVTAFKKGLYLMRLTDGTVIYTRRFFVN